ncbi:MAG TPA: SGNH/GDSL hydrolase family protein, partial [Candidatus Saccharimonadales bacterium]|nr:SGNH/GDSL hydrolase family protein [Candidatus Saccharimonadales bacterium]
NGNIDCSPEGTGACAVATAYGTADTTGTVTLGDSTDYHPVVSHIDGRQHFIAIPNSSQFITYTTDPAIGFYFYFNYSFLSSVTLKNEGLGAYYQINRPPDGILADKTGHKLAGDYESVSFSENGQWMIVSNPNIAMLRVNLRTFEVLAFASGFDYSIGLSPAIKTAISNDGRYAAVASKNYSRFSIYDLDTCGGAPDTISGPVNCASRDLQSLTSQSVSGFTSVSNLRFLSDEALGFYAGYTDNGVNKTAKYILSSGLGAANQQDYLALGDSYISGEGAFRYLPGTDTYDNKCHVSEISYPRLIGQELNYNSYHSVTCSGATTDDIISQSENYGGQVVSKIQRWQYSKDKISSILSNFQPGYIDQLDFVKQYQPKLITISIGGNDIGFSDRLRQCLGPGACYSTYEDRLEFVNEVNKAFPKLVSTYAKLKAAGAANARIYVIGYPQIAKADGDCALNVHMNHDELIFAQQAIDYIDAVVKAAADRAGVLYVDTRNALVGHRLCEAKPGSVAMNGISAGNDFPDKLGGPIGRESYHPNDFGHLLLDNSVRAATHNLTDPMPAPDSLAKPPGKNGLDILNASKSGRPINQTEYDSDLAPDITYNQTPFNVSISANEHALVPSTILTAELHSVPVNLSNFTTD